MLQQMSKRASSRKEYATSAMPGAARDPAQLKELATYSPAFASPFDRLGCLGAYSEVPRKQTMPSELTACAIMAAPWGSPCPCKQFGQASIRAYQHHFSRKSSLENAYTSASLSHSVHIAGPAISTIKVELPVTYSISSYRFKINIKLTSRDPHHNALTDHVDRTSPFELFP